MREMLERLKQLPPPPPPPRPPGGISPGVVFALLGLALVGLGFASPWRVVRVAAIVLGIIVATMGGHFEWYVRTEPKRHARALRKWQQMIEDMERRTKSAV
jgi:hypothetical protein